MKRALILVLLVGLLGPEKLSSQDNLTLQRISFVGYGLLKKSNDLNIIKTDLIKTKKKLLNIDALNDLEICFISRLIENISLVEIICRYEGLILGTLHQIGEKNRLTQYRVHENRLRHYTLKNLYLHYKATQADNAKVEEEVILVFADKASKEMSTVAELIEEVIEILQSQSSPSP